jgi:hypothetical protein
MKRAVVREGKNQVGVVLRELCVFCKERFRSLKQRTDHTNFCLEGQSSVETHAVKNYAAQRSTSA